MIVIFDLRVVLASYCSRRWKYLNDWYSSAEEGFKPTTKNSIYLLQPPLRLPLTRPANHNCRFQKHSWTFCSRKGIETASSKTGLDIRHIQGKYDYKFLRRNADSRADGGRRKWRHWRWSTDDVGSIGVSGNAGSDHRGGRRRQKFERTSEIFASKLARLEVN